MGKLNQRKQKNGCLKAVRVGKNLPTMTSVKQKKKRLKRLVRRSSVATDYARSAPVDLGVYLTLATVEECVQNTSGSDLHTVTQPRLATVGVRLEKPREGPDGGSLLTVAPRFPSDIDFATTAAYIVCYIDIPKSGVKGKSKSHDTDKEGVDTPERAEVS